MATYCVSDIHGEYEKYLLLLGKIRFSDADTLYVLGDMVDRGPQPLAVVQDIMKRKNVVALAGNHDCLAAIYLRKLIYGGRATDLDEETMMDIFIWMQDGARTTITDFCALSIPDRQRIVEWLTDLYVYREIRVKGRSYVLVHAGLGNNPDPARPLDDYSLEELLFTLPDYHKAVYPNKYIVSGHTPTSTITDNPNPQRIFRMNRNIVIDCGATFGGRLAALCLENGEEFYV